MEINKLGNSTESFKFRNLFNFLGAGCIRRVRKLYEMRLEVARVWEFRCVC